MVLALGAIAIALMALFPPWNFVYDFPGDDFYVNRPAYKAERFAGYYAIWKSNAPTDQSQLAALFPIPADQRSSLQRLTPERGDTAMNERKIRLSR